MALGIVELAILLFVCGVPFFLGIVFVVILLARSRSANVNPANPQSPLEILQERYARGEIDSEEFETRRQRILDDSQR